MTTTASEAFALEHDAELQSLREELLRHPIYSLVDDQAELRAFMRCHVFCVWDFQCLMKSLQRTLTCVTLPWLPTADPAARRMINEITLDEESDLTPDGRPLSHFEMYVEAMRDCGADTGPIQLLLSRLAAGVAWPSALQHESIPQYVRDFVAVTMRYACDAPVHQVAAAFAYGREDVIPAMFTQLVNRLAEDGEEYWGMYRYYLERHISHDGDTHGPMARRLVARLCGDSPQFFQEAKQAALESLRARIDFWTSLAEEISLV